MQLNRGVLFLFCFLIFSPLIAANNQNNETVEINFSNLSISDFTKMVSKIIGKNILITTEIPGKVDFVTDKPLKKSELMSLLVQTLESKGYTIIDTKRGYMKIVPIAEAAKNALPVNEEGALPQMGSKTIKLNYIKAADAINAVKHLSSKNGSIVLASDSNALVITDFPDQISMIKKVLKALEKDSSKSVTFVAMKDTKVGYIYETAQKMSQTMFGSNPAQQVEVLKDDGANGLILIGSKDNINTFLPYISKLDNGSSSGMRQRTVVVTMKNGDAENIAKILSDILAKKTYPKDAIKPLITPDAQLNAVVVVGASEDVEELKSILISLDTPRQQVYVKAKIVEINTNAEKEIGVRYGIDGWTANSSGLYSFASKLGGSAVPLPAAYAAYMTVPAVQQGLALGATISLLQNDGAANLLSEPSVLCINNQESTIYVGQNVPILSTQQVATQTTSLPTQTYTRQDIGLTLKVKPRLTSDNKVTLSVDATLEDIEQQKSTQGLPQTSKRQVKSSAIVTDGESVVIGGLIRNNFRNQSAQVPLLGDIPVVGNLFKWKADTDEKINLVILLTPYIVNKSDDLTTLREKLWELDKIQDQYVANIKKLKPWLNSK